MKTKQTMFIDRNQSIHGQRRCLLDFTIDYLFSALTSSVDRFKYLSRSIINNKSRRLARHIRFAAFYIRIDMANIAVDQQVSSSINETMI
jgi:hypothetical protein